MPMTASDVRYCLYSWSPHEERLFNEHGSKPVPISGLYNWASVMGGVRRYLPTPKSAEGFTHIHVNVTSLSLQAIPFIRSIADAVGAKLIANVDYAVELWTENLKFPHLLASMLDKVDFVFSVNSEMSWALSSLIKRPVYTIPHPTNGEALKKLASSHASYVSGSIATVLHRYDKNFIPAWLIINGLSCRNGLFGTLDFDHAMFPLFDDIRLNLPFEDFCAALTRYEVVLDSYTLLSYGRVQVECAFLGIPCVGFSCVESQNLLWPSFSVPVNSLRRAREAVLSAFSDQSRRIAVPSALRTAENVYSYAACRTAMLRLICS